MKSFKEHLQALVHTKKASVLSKLALILAFRQELIHARDLKLSLLSVEFSNVFSWDYPDFVDAYVDHGTYSGVLLPDYIIDEINGDPMLREKLLRDYLN